MVVWSGKLDDMQLKTHLKNDITFFVFMEYQKIMFEIKNQLCGN